MSDKRKCTRIVQIDKDTHKILKILSAELNMAMGQIVKAMALSLLICGKEEGFVKTFIKTKVGGGDQE